ncbi:MAG: hypothetical protein OXC26_09795 [Albidovulum sp.]|nr:hypothetical protein [Albidovulum sp.]
MTVAKILVSDTSVLVDPERGILVEAAFRPPFEFAVPDLLYDRDSGSMAGRNWSVWSSASRNWMAMPATQGGDPQAASRIFRSLTDHCSSLLRVHLKFFEA